MTLLKWKDAKNLIGQGHHLLIFSTKWCGDCALMKMILNQIHDKWANKGFTFIEVDAEETDFFRKDDDHTWKILKVPAIYLISNGIVNFLGYEFIPQDMIEQALETIVVEE